MAQARLRRGYLDWLRGVAVIIMIEAHVIDSWTRLADRRTREFAWALIVGGFGAPLFLFLAGVAVPMSASAKARRSGDVGAAAGAVARRGGEVFLLGLLFRVQSWIVSWAPTWSLLKVDILNIMGPSIAAAAAVWGVARTTRGRIIGFTILTLAVALLTPIVRNLPIVAQLPDPLEAYLRPVPDLTNFVFFPWSAFLFAGAIVGVVLNATPADGETRANLGFAGAGIVMTVAAYAASFGPSPYAQSRFWTTAPTFFFLRLGILLTSVSVAYAWERRPHGVERWSPLRQLGRTSLFIYWIHVEMVYGLMSLSLHKRLPLSSAWIALAVFCVFMLICSIAKDRIVTWWNNRPRSRRLTSPSSGPPQRLAG